MASLYPTFNFDKAADFLREFSERKGIVEAGVAVEGPAAAYAEVWEWGNVRQTKQGPRTVLGTNPDGEQVWLSSQAPYGYIRVNTEKYVAAVKVNLEKLPLTSITAQGLLEEIEEAARESMKEAVQILHDTAPVDTTQLQNSFVVVEGGDDLLENDPGGRIESRFNRVLNLSENL